MKTKAVFQLLLMAIIMSCTSLFAQTNSGPVALKQNGEYVIQNKAGFVAAMNKILDNKGSVEGVKIREFGDRFGLVFRIQLNNGNRVILGFELEQSGGGLNAVPVPGQKCTGIGCSQCNWNNSGWGCHCDPANGGGGECEHEMTSITLGDVIAEMP